MDIGVQRRETFELEVSDLHTLQVRDKGNPEGVPVIELHGGPGAGMTCQGEKLDLEKFRVINFSQRGSADSLQVGEKRENTTQDLVKDIEKIRTHLNIDSAILLAESWGTTLAIQYAVDYPGRVKEMVLTGVFLGTQSEIDWWISGAKEKLPEAHKRLSVYAGGRDGSDLLRFYDNAVKNGDKRAVMEWCNYETALAINRAGSPLEFVREDQLNDTAIALTQLEIHYFLNTCFLEPNALINRAHEIQVPVHIIQGERDWVTHGSVAKKLHEVLPNSSLETVGGGHGFSEIWVRDAVKKLINEMV